MFRKPVIAGNWKMNTLPFEGVELARSLREKLGEVANVEVVIAPPFTHLHAINEEVKGTPIRLAAQNLNAKDSGAYTGEISAAMLLTMGCDFAIIGHSERRQYFGETDDSVNEKILAALANQLTPIVCVGETLEEREANKTLEVIATQLSGALKGLTAEGWKDIIVAYEPVWAIGTGKTASNEQAQEVHGFIRSELEKSLGKAIADKTRILYGGSVKPDSICGLMDQPDIDGALVGGASLKAEDFVKIVNFGKG
ncbi:MAG: triose-phosphate isomerase [Proteobacteria bacterium]|nr:triose-phosphate isomerase [Pseudomonadota bacterium]